MTDANRRHINRTTGSVATDRQSIAFFMKAVMLRLPAQITVSILPEETAPFPVGSDAMKDARISLLIWWITALMMAFSVASCGGSRSDPAVATVVDANRAVADNAFTATLTGAQEVPPNATAAIGAGTVIIDANTRALSATVTTAGIAGTAASVHESPPGLIGSIVFPLGETSPGTGIWTAQVTLTDAQISALRAGNYYFSVRSAANPGGEIRGPILPRMSTPSESGANGVGTTAAGTTTATVFKNALTGTQAIPAASTTATALVTTAVDNVAKTLAVAVNTIGITGTEAHVHEAAPGRNGQIVVPLSQTSGGSGIWFAKASLSDAQTSSVMDGNYYVDVHSAAFPNGEVRGQIARLRRKTHVDDCRFGGFGFDDCRFDGFGFFIGFGFGGFGIDGSGFDGPGFNGSGFDGFEPGNGRMADVPSDGGPVGSDTPAPGIIF
jgi:hypothetical protein